MYKTKVEKEKLYQMEEFFKSNIEILSPGIKRVMNHYEIPELNHYTSLSNLFNILESDSLWLSGLHFSNDSSEEKLLGEKWLYDNNYTSDNFIFCVGEKCDVLSQWRGYCVNGGASIGLDVSRLRKYSVLYNDFDKRKKNIIVGGIALPVLYTPEKFSYTPEEEGAQYIIREIKDILDRNHKNTSLLCINDFVPYIKHFAFREEQERRLLISNANGRLSKCISFRELQNGTKIPYIVIKCEYVDDSRKTKSGKTEKKIKSIIDNNEFAKTVVVPDYSNQEEICNLVRLYIKTHTELIDDGDINVFCEGHLPIRSITISPMPDQNRMKEQVSRFCQSKYWLKDVDIRKSNIPYVTSVNSL